jgi:hypothetical protein
MTCCQLPGYRPKSGREPAAPSERRVQLLFAIHTQDLKRIPIFNYAREAALAAGAGSFPWSNLTIDS